MKRTAFARFLYACLALVLAACATLPGAVSETPAQSTTADATATANPEATAARPAGWTEASHSNTADPDYGVVFPQDKVNQITLLLTPEDWAALQANLTELLGEPGTRGPGGGGGAPPAGGFGQPPAGGDQGGFPPAAGQGGGLPMGGDFTTENPMWVQATVVFEGQTWTNVGFRYKGNSSLQNAWNNSSLKLPFKLDFDEFEDAVPAIDDQRFYGFQQLAFANGFGDATYMRDALTYDVLAEAGLPAAETAFYEVVVDYGEGEVSLGVYTAVEVIDDTVIERVFGDDDGNIYEGDGAGVTLAAGAEAQISTSFQKENNSAAADWRDLEALYTALHAETRTTNPEAWRAGLEAVFNVDGFLEWLAVSAVLAHWDTYGQMTHNFYLYNDPDTGQLTWISWDHNLVLGAQAGPGGGRGPSRSVSFDKADVGENWPLIRYLLDDPVYAAQYDAHLAALAAGGFDTAALTAKLQTWSAVLTPAIERAGETAAFTEAVTALTTTLATRAAALAEFVAAQP